MFITDAGYGLLMITTMGYVAGSDNQASLNVNSAAGFLGPADKVRAGAARKAGAAPKLFSLKAFRAARLKTPAAAIDILPAGSSAGSVENEVFEARNSRAEPCAAAILGAQAAFYEPRTF